MKTILAVIAVLTTLAPANAGWLKVERGCGSKCPVPPVYQPMFPKGVNAVLYPDGIPDNVMIGDRPAAVGDTESPTYQSRSQSVIRSQYGTSVINSTYRSYSR